MATSAYRTINRFVQFDIKLTGDPVVWTPRHEGARPISVESVRLTFGHGDEGVSVTANVQGRYMSSTGKPLKKRTDEYSGAPDLWPAWLKALADRHRPEEFAEHRGPLVAYDKNGA